MPCRYVIDKEWRLIVGVGWDCVTFAEIKALQDQYTNDPDFDPTFNHLIDGTSVTSLELSIDDAKQIATRRIFSATSRGAFVTTKPAYYGIGRLIQTYHEFGKMPDQARVFYKREEALKWLGLPGNYQISK